MNERAEPSVGDAEGLGRRPGLLSRLYNGETRFDFVGRKKIWYLLSLSVILASIVGGALQGGLNLGIDFRGGSSWEVPADVSVPRVRDEMAKVGQPDARIQRFTPTAGDPFVRVSTRLEGTAAEVNTKSLEIRDHLSKELADGRRVDFSTVGPSWGGEITKKARNALVVFFLVIALYLSTRFEWRMALSALVAVVHDIFVTVGVYALVGFEVTPASVVAFLTILGFSLYDTVVVFDRVDENARSMGATGRFTFSDIVNTSMNQVLMRSLNTSFVAILPIGSVLVIGSFVLGATSLQDFGLALLIGLITGAYSSVFIATPVLAALKEREPRYAQIRARLQQRGELQVGVAMGSALLRPGAAARRGGGGGTLRPTARSEKAAPAERVALPDAIDEAADESVPVGAGSPTSVSPGQPPKSKATGSPAVQPRPRKKGKRR